MHIYVTHFLLILANYQVLINCLQCVDENKEPVDWFTVYKIPKIKHENPLIRAGVGYVYLTSNNYNRWTLSKNSINNSNSILGNTLKPFYSTNTSYILYNDQPPNQPKKSEKGHTKGVLLADENGGFWLVHSVPHFPSLTNAYQFSQSGLLKGQSFLCISLDLNNLDLVGAQLKYNEPQIYANYIQNSIQNNVKALVQLISGQVVKNAPWFNMEIIHSINETKFFAFAKSRHFLKELYVDWVAPQLQSDLYAETWLNGPGRIPSECDKKFKVYNIENVTIQTAQASFSDSEDHSKWVVDVESNWICIGDINRMEHQKVRGGGTVCLKDEKLAQNYKSSVNAIEKCSTMC